MVHFPHKSTVRSPETSLVGLPLLQLEVLSFLTVTLFPRYPVKPVEWQRRGRRGFAQIKRICLATEAGDTV